MVYIIILTILFLYSAWEIRIGPVDKRDLVYWFFLIVFILISGLRWKVGGDSFAYQELFEMNLDTKMGFFDLLEENLKYEPFFLMFMVLCKAIINEFWFFQLCHAIFINITIFYFIRRYCTLKFTGLLIYSFFFYFYFNMEILREAIAVCIFLWMYPFFVKRKWIKYYLLALVAIMFHYSALTLLFFPIFRNVTFKFKSAIVIVVIVFAIVIFSANFSSFLGMVGQDSLATRYLLYSNVTLNVFGIVYNSIFYVILPYFFYVFNKARNYPENFPSLLFLYFLIAIIFCVISGFGRLLNYLTPFLAVYYVNSIKQISYDRNVRQIKWLLLLIVLGVPFCMKTMYYYQSTSNLVPNTRKINLWYPYSTIMTKDEYLNREYIYKAGIGESFEKAIENL
jgi:hypothetical protein